MAGTIFTCVDFFLCVVSGDLVFLASISDRKLLAKIRPVISTKWKVGFGVGLLGRIHVLCPLSYPILPKIGTVEIMFSCISR
jgi:hypothetical protein